MPPKHPIHLAGSSPYTTATEALTAFATSLPDGRLKRIPDGEVGVRNYFTGWQGKVFPPFILCERLIPGATAGAPPLPPNFVLKAEDLQPTGYDDAAIESYQEFGRLKSEGVIAPGTRFQVCLPSPISVVMTWVRDEYIAAAEELYTVHLLAALRRIVDNIPHGDLAIQWDCPLELAHMEHAYGVPREGSVFFPAMKPWYDDVQEHVIASLSRLGNAVADDVQVGFHLCYGDMGNVHWLEPADTKIMTDVINGVADRVKRPVDWFHLPVPKGRVDEDYFAPLKGLNQDARKAELYLGLVHPHDEQGTQKRLEVAKRVLGHDEFGVGSECGFGRTPKENLESIYSISRAVS